jgi:hypothetical protein
MSILAQSAGGVGKIGKSPASSSGKIHSSRPEVIRSVDPSSMKETSFFPSMTFAIAANSRPETTARPGCRTMPGIVAVPAVSRS